VVAAGLVAAGVEAGVEKSPGGTGQLVGRLSGVTSGIMTDLTGVTMTDLTSVTMIGLVEVMKGVMIWQPW